jgi:outer membrane protein OmpA-like peptidoglycan-associated protein
MRHLVTLSIVMLALRAQAAPDAGNKFELHDSGSAAKNAHGAHESKLEPTKTDAVMKFFVIDKDKGPVKGIVVELTSPAGAKFFTEETDAEGYAEALVPVGQKYELTYLSLGRKDIAASVDVKNEPKQTVKLTLRYKPRPPAPPFVLKGVTFDTARATIRPESFPMLDVVAEFMAHKKSARLEISGHTDNVGNPKTNKKLSEDRAKACRNYLVGKGIDVGRITAIGYGDTKPVAPNDSDENRQKNRRIEAIEIVSN